MKSVQYIIVFLTSLFIKYKYYFWVQYVDFYYTHFDILQVILPNFGYNNWNGFYLMFDIYTVIIMQDKLIICLKLFLNDHSS